MAAGESAWSLECNSFPHPLIHSKPYLRTQPHFRPRALYGCGRTNNMPAKSTIPAADTHKNANETEMNGKRYQQRPAQPRTRARGPFIRLRNSGALPGLLIFFSLCCLVCLAWPLPQPYPRPSRSSGTLAFLFPLARQHKLAPATSPLFLRTKRPQRKEPYASSGPPFSSSFNHDSDSEG